MKKVLRLLLVALFAIAVLAGCGKRHDLTPSAVPTATLTPTPAATYTPTPSPEPWAGKEIINGFYLVETRNFPLIQADISLYEHIKTGAKFVYVANEDTNRAFQLTFNTRPIDDTGLPHVFEHSCLCGSEKYPYDQLWWAVSYQTYNTYVNAYTTDAMTSYPVGSLSEEQLLKLAEYYTDACYKPLILQDESIFKTEAWRYRLENAEDPLTLEGTVYSEMLGSYTLNRFASQMAYKTAFPGSVLGFDYGGNPDHIPEMTWESLKNYHSLYYHPSNSVAYLYGKIENMAAYLELLDSYYSKYEKSEFKFEDTNYERLTKAKQAEFAYPVAEGSAVEDRSQVDYYIILPGLRDSIEEERVIDNLLSLLSSESSVFGQAMKADFPSAQYGMGREIAAEDDAVCVTVVNVNKEDASKIESIINKAFKDVAQNGFADDLVDSYMASINLSTKLSSENSEPIDGILHNLSYHYAVTGDVFRYIDDVAALEEIAKMNKGAYQEAAKKWLVNAKLTSLTVTYPVAGMKEENEKALADKLAQTKASMTQEQLTALVDETNAPEKTEDYSKEIAYLKVVDVSNLPEETRVYDVNDVTGEDGIRRIDAVANVDGVGTAAIYLNANALPQEDIHWFRLYTRLLGKFYTDKHTDVELPVLMDRYLYDNVLGISILDDAEDEEDGYSVYFVASWTAMDEDLQAGYDLVKELLFDTDFDYPEVLLEDVKAQMVAVRNSITQSCYSVELYRSLGTEIPSVRLQAYMNYIEYYQFLEKVKEQLENGSKEPIERLSAMKTFLNNKAGAMLTFAGNEESIKLNRKIADAFVADMPSETREQVVYDLPAASYNEALIVDSNVQYNGLVANYGQLELEEYDAGLDAVTSLVTDMILVPILRDGYGVYTPMNGFLPAYGMYLITYRDPNVRETFSVYSTLADKIREIEIDQETLNGYILSAYSEYAKPQGELAGASSAISSTIANTEQDYIVECMKQLKALTPEKVKTYADLYAKAWDNGCLFTAGGAGAINDNADIYDEILNPFNSKDTTKTEFTDITKDGEYSYEALRFAFENKYMLPESETVFGTNSDATVADLVGFIYSINGGTAGDFEGGRALLAKHGIISEDQQPDEVLIEKTFCDILNKAYNLGLETDTPDLVMKRGDLAEFIYEVMNEADE